MKKNQPHKKQCITDWLNLGGHHPTAPRVVPEEEIVERCMVVKQMVMIGPLDVRYGENQMKRLKDMMEEYNKQNFMKYMSGNIKFHGRKNLMILDRIKNQVFWNTTLPKMITYATDRTKLQSISTNIAIIGQKTQQLLTLSKAQILMMIITMFFCIFPKQSHRQQLSFAQLMQQQKKDENIKIKQQKLKCFINYFNIIINQPYKQLQKQKIQIYRVQNKSGYTELKKNHKIMGEFQIRCGLIEQQYKKCIMVDFANKRIGGGILGHGSVQEEIMFCMFPELMVTMCTCQEMLDDQAIIITGAEKINEYEGYAHSFKFKGTAQKVDGPYQSVIMAIDSIDYSSQITQYQYSQNAIFRQIIKVLTGIQGCNIVHPDMAVSTGRWGCGTFKGDSYLKYLIQWIACSIAGRKIMYKCKDQVEREEVMVMSKVFKKYEISEVIATICQCIFFIKNGSKQMSFLQILKEII